MIFQEESGDKDTEPSYLCDAELDNETIGKAQSSPLFIQERRESAERRQAYHSYEESLLPAQSIITHTQERGDPCTNLARAEKNQVAKWNTKQSGFSLKDKKSKFSLIFRAEIQKHEFQADSDRIIESQRREIDHTLAGDEQFRRDQLLLHEQLSEQNRALREAQMKSLNETDEWKRFQGSIFDEFSRERLIENQDTIHEVTARIQELQIEVHCLNDSREFKDAEPVHSGQSHVTSQPAFFTHF